MKTILLTLAIWLLAFPVGVKSEDTLYTIANIHIQFVNVILDSVWFDDTTALRVGNLYVAMIERLPVDPDGWCLDIQMQRQDSNGVWYGMDTTICSPSRVYDVIIIEQQPDIDCSGVADISDLIWLIDYMF